MQALHTLTCVPNVRTIEWRKLATGGSLTHMEEMRCAEVTQLLENRKEVGHCGDR
jgi:hypothetical protein